MNYYLAICNVAVCFLCSFSTVVFSQTWPDVRDGVIYIKHQSMHVDSTNEIAISWSDAWISESQEDHVYLQGPDGSLVDRLDLNEENTPGKRFFKTVENGDYRLEVTGANYRNVTISIQDDISTVFEPVKIHKSISLPKSGRIYFSVPKGKSFRFSGKRYGAISTFYVKSVASQKRYKLALNKKTYYWQYDHVVVPAEDKDDVYEVTWNGNGKVSFWLDDIPNLFALKKKHLFVPVLNVGSANIDISDEIVGDMPEIGAALPYVYPPKEAWSAINSWQLQSANYYFFADDLKTSPKRDMPFLDLYENTFDIRTSNSILANTGRDTVLNPTNSLKSRLSHYLKDRHSLSLLSNNFVALADEPNLNYSNYDHFDKYFSSLASFIKNHPDPMVSNTKLAVPQSSRFLNGPTRKDADKRIGIHWAEKLVSNYGQWIDAISWHEWLVRDLIDTKRYADAVTRASELVEKYSETLNDSTALIIGQTNISSGLSLSPYEQETFFAALWWTSVVIQSSLPGKLDQIMWFKAADDPVYKKGLIQITKNGYIHKPVSEAMAFINSHIHPFVMNLTNKHPDVDVLVTLSADKKMAFILGVNKSKRDIHVDLNLPVVGEIVEMAGLNKGGIVEVDVSSTSNKVLSGVIPKETIFSIKLLVEKMGE